MATKKKLLQEHFAEFYENPTRDKLREVLKSNLGEFPNLDFKEQWLPFPQIARHILGIANAGGGCIVIGVAEGNDKTLQANGVKTLVDKSEITNGIKRYLPNVLLDETEIGDFSYEASEYSKIVGKKFQVVFIPSDPKRLPYISLTEGEGIRNNIVYTRRGTTTVETNYEELQGIINRRVETGYSSQTEVDLRTHIEQLKMLYSQIDKVHVLVTGGIYEAFRSFSQIAIMGGTRKEVLNPIYPQESFEDFIVKMIEKKKKKIEVFLDVASL